VPTLSDDRPLYLDIARMRELILDGTLRREVEQITGPLS